MSQSETFQKNTDDLIKIMIATDNHLGYCEKDPVRGKDSFIAFEEILELADNHDVDFILLGGDLFHDATPSQNTLNECMKLLRRVTLGDKPISLEFLSDQTVNFVDALHQTVNYEDPNLNVSIPVFSIHGNHDDPSGFGRLSSLDILSTTGLINYFGKWTDLTKITINPILLKKGETQLALYGLSHIHDARLSRLFRESKVVMETPPESTGTWFNLMVLHQNRADRGPNNYLPEDILPNFLNLVIWGHEHDCRIEPEYNCTQKFCVSQPGSSVATSLSEGESLPKHCAILYIHKDQFEMKPLPLKTVRPFLFKSISLVDYIDECHLDEGGADEKVMELAKEKIEEMITKASEMITGEQRRQPLIRLRIIYTDEEQTFNTIRFGQQFNNRVANPSELILFKKQIKRNKSDTKNFNKSVMDDIQSQTDSQARVEDVVKRYFDEVKDPKLDLMSLKILQEMCFRLVERNDGDAADNIMKFYKQKANSYLTEKLPNENELDLEILNFKEKETENYENVLQMLDKRGNKKDVDYVYDTSKTNGSTGKRTNTIEILDDSFNKGGATRGRGGATRGGRGRGRGRGAAASSRAELDVSIQAKSNSRQNALVSKQSSIMDSFSQIADRAQTTRARTKKAQSIVYEISDDFD